MPPASGYAVQPMNKNEYTNPLKTAQYLLTNGISTIPIRYGDKRPHAVVLEKTTGNTSWKPFASELPDCDILTTWFNVPVINLGIVMSFGVAVLDFDNAHEFSYWFRDHGKKLGSLSLARTSRGVHVYFSHSENTASGKIINAAGDLVGDLKISGYVVAPPSRHASGKIYHWNKGGLAGMANLTKQPFTIMQILGPTLKIAEPPTCLAPNYGSTISASSPWELDPMQITDLVQVTASNDGHYAHGLCPLHPDKNNSFWVNLERNTCGCWTCGFSGITVKELKARLR